MTRLARVVPYESAGYGRRATGRGFTYLDASGARAQAEDRERIEALAIPPAWAQVWIAESPTAHIQAVGVDAAGRRQYRYHPAWLDRHSREKFDRMLALAHALPAARRRVTGDLRSSGRTRERVLAAAFRILDTVAIRVGGDEYAATSGTRGVSTLLGRHVRIDGDTVRFTFPAKGGRRSVVEVTDVDLARVMGEVRRGASTRMLTIDTPAGPRALRAHDINQYVCDRTGGAFTAKDFRTLRGTLVAAEVLARAAASAERARRSAIVDAVAAAAEALGNTPAVARSSYVDPRVITRFRAGVVLDTTISPEAALIRLLSP